jgi:DNA repair exonuclease SbcCD nuclease subunit
MAHKDIDFDKTVVFTDIHYGMKNNSREHNITCENFIKWMIEQAEEWGSRTCIFAGDWHHIRSAINISTLNYSVSGLRYLNDYFDNVIFLLGNHDLFYRDKYEIHSIPYIDQFSNIRLVDKIDTIDDVAFVPWLVGDDWKKVSKIRSPYMFGHFELPRFKMNAMVEMPDHGQLNTEHFQNQKQVFSGHFHKRQNQDKIWYIGNCFPHNYSDAWDDDRGLMFWEPGKEPTFKMFPDSPKYRTMPLSKLLTDPLSFIDNKTYARIGVDIEINYEELNFLKETFEKDVGAREIVMQSMNLDTLEISENANINFESVDTIVISHLQSIESNTIDNKKLVDIYQSL